MQVLSPPARREFPECPGKGAARPAPHGGAGKAFFRPSVRIRRIRANARARWPRPRVSGGVRRSGGECYNPRMKARRSSSGKDVLRERRRRARLSRVALLAAGEKERERRIEVAAAKSAVARSAGLPPSELPPEQAVKFRAAVAAVRAGDIPACIVCAGDMTLNGNVPGGRWECPGGCFAFSISVGD